MQSTIYLIRHAQSMPRSSQPQSRWRLSPVGLAQADQLASLLVPLEIQRVFSSPFTRSLATAAPFAKLTCLEIGVLDALMERSLDGVATDSDQDWLRSWDDFTFASPQGESAAEAQSRFVDAVRAIAGTGGTCAVFAHGHVIALFLNSIDSRLGRKEAEALMNPDVLKITCR